MRRFSVGVTVCALLSLSVVGGPAAVAGVEQPDAPRYQPPTEVHNDDGRLADGQGRSVVLRGINVVDKQGWTGRLADPMLTPDMVRQLADMGFNHVRFGTTWASIQHDREAYDEDYIDQMLEQLDLLDRYGLRAVVDMHQDVWSAQLGSDGAPAWADPQCNVPPNPDLAGASGQWMVQYGSPAANAAWANFWNDGYAGLDPHCTGQVQSEFVQMWGHLSSRLADHPAVIGYDLLNEPWPSAPPEVFEQLYLMPMYQRAAAAIREHDPTTPIFFEPPLYSPAVPTVAFTPPDPNAVFAPHIYTETMFSGGAVSTGARTDEIVLAKDMEDAARMDVPLWIGEWGALHDPAYIAQMYDLFDRYQAGAAFWADVQQPGEQFDGEHEEPHVRPYPEAYPGDATWSYDREAKRFTMTVAVDEGHHRVQLVVPERLGLTTNDPSVAFVSAGPGKRPCKPGQGPAAKPEAPGGCRAIWQFEGPGTFTLTLE